MTKACAGLLFFLLLIYSEFRCSFFLFFLLDFIRNGMRVGNASAFNFLLSSLLALMIAFLP